MRKSFFQYFQQYYEMTTSLSFSLSLTFSPISTSKGDKTRQESVAKTGESRGAQEKVGLNKSRSYVGKKGSTG